MRQIELVDRTSFGVGELHRPRHDGGQHGRKIERRIDRLAHLAEGLELLDRAGEFGRALTQLLEQSGILNRDDGLPCKVTNQLNLLVRERPHFFAKNTNRANWLALFKQRHTQNGSYTREVG